MASWSLRRKWNFSSLNFLEDSPPATSLWLASRLWISFKPELLSTLYICWRQTDVPGVHSPPCSPPSFHFLLFSETVVFEMIIELVPVGMDVFFLIWFWVGTKEFVPFSSLLWQGRVSIPPGNAIKIDLPTCSRCLLKVKSCPLWDLEKQKFVVRKISNFSFLCVYWSKSSYITIPLYIYGKYHTFVFIYFLYLHRIINYYFLNKNILFAI